MTDVCPGPDSRATTAMSLRRETLTTYPGSGSASTTSTRADE